MKELESTVEELEALRDISQELEENQAVVEKQLRSEICLFQSVNLTYSRRQRD